MRRPLVGTALCLANLLYVAAAARGSADDARYLNGLRARGLFELAEKYCADELAEPRLSDARRADLTIELSRTLAQHALDSPPEMAPGLWRKAEQVATQFAEQHPGHPHVILVRLQGALALAVEGEAAREAAAGSSEPEATAAAREALRRAIAQLRELADEIARELRGRGRATGRPGELSTAQLQSLEMNVRYELARALRNQALAYSPGTPDRINALSQALEALSLLPRRLPQSPLEWSAALEEIACWRLLGEYPRAERKLLELEKTRPPDEFAARLRAERIQIALARGRIDEALSEAGAGQQPTGPEAEMARLDALLAAWRRAGGQRNHSEASEWQNRAVAEVRAIGSDYGPYWLRKAETKLARNMADSEGPQSAELLAQAAASYYRSGQVERALAAYDRAAAQAREMRQPAQAFEAAFTAATIEKERKHFREALERYRTLAAQPGAPKAAEAHLLAVYCAAQLAQAERPPNLDEYERMLREHVARWPEDPTSSQARVWLARLSVHRGQPQQAIEMLRDVAPADPQLAAAIETMGSAYEASFAQLHERGEDVGRLPDEALAWFERARPRRGGKPTPASRAAALAAARIWLLEVPTGALPAERILREALDHDPAAPDDWQAQARRLLAPALAAQGKRAQAADVVKQIPRAGAADRLAMLRAISEVRGRTSGDVQRNVAALELAAADDLLNLGNQLDAATARAAKRERAVALAAVGRRAEALEQLQSLADAFPNDGLMQEELARQLGSGDQPDLPAALAKWSEVAVRSRPGTPRWFRANLGLARTQLELGRVGEARATLERVADKYPDFGGEARKRQFEALAAEIKGPSRGGN